ncbi:MAG: 8-amino-7-oxononanoate synthase [Labilithrix sp.]|nr:8-amino-7-oxononanoate synthase [Labilithrix sp.]
MTHTTDEPDGPLAHLREALSNLEERGLRRFTPRPAAAGALSFCSNDYLGLAARAAPPHVPVGSGASRLIAGEHHAHAALEHALAAWLGLPACLVFTSGYAANVGAVSALAAPGDLIVSDALNHASLIDGARLSRARVVVTPHNDVDAIAAALRDRPEARAWVVVESYYSMDADGPDLARLRHVCDEHDAALYLDEAHALGMFGPRGRGLAAAAGVAPDVFVGTLGKAFGSQGAFVAGSRALRDWLWNRARSFVFSTGLSPAAAAAATSALVDVAGSAERRETVHALAARMREGLAALGRRPLGFGHVIPVIVGSSERAAALSDALAIEGLVVPPIRPPTVPEGTARLRFTMTARHELRDIERALDACRRAFERHP